MLGGDPLDFLRAFKHNKNVYFDTSLARPGIIMEYLRTIGPERLIFGSDVPFGMMSQELEKIFSLPIGEDERNLILSKNIKGLIRLS
jgi:predicted TIM-barrel fold metal-dependent hydrolase